MKTISLTPERDNVITRYNKPAIFMHWTIFLLVVIAYVAINVRGPKGSDLREFWTGIHLWAGLLVLSLALVRVGWRLIHNPPPDEPGSALMISLAKAAPCSRAALTITSANGGCAHVIGAYHQCTRCIHRGANHSIAHTFTYGKRFSPVSMDSSTELAPSSTAPSYWHFLTWAHTQAIALMDVGKRHIFFGALGRSYTCAFGRNERQHAYGYAWLHDEYA